MVHSTDPGNKGPHLRIDQSVGRIAESFKVQWRVATQQCVVEEGGRNR